MRVFVQPIISTHFYFVFDQEKSFAEVEQLN